MCTKNQSSLSYISNSLLYGLEFIHKTKDRQFPKKYLRAHVILDFLKKKYEHQKNASFLSKESETLMDKDSDSVTTDGSASVRGASLLFHIFPNLEE